LSVTRLTEFFVPGTNVLRLLAPAAFAIALGGCSMDLSGFSVAELNPLKGSDPLRSADYNYFYKRDQSASTGVVTAADLVGPDGRCAFDPAPTYSPAAPDTAAQTPAADPINPRSNQALYFTAGPEANATSAAPNALPPQVRSGPSGIGLQMTECQVVRVAGYTDRVEIGADPRGQRTVTLTYLSGDRPGIYRFVGGRLASMERVAEPAQPKKPQRATKTAKKTSPRQ
jgi:hypothetical protein